MHNVKKNEKGYALIIVLLVIVIIGIMTPPIISKIMSSSSQYQKVEEDLQLEKLGEMGVSYTEKAIDETEAKSEEKAKREADKKAKVAGEIAANSLSKKASDSERQAAYKAAYNKMYREVYIEEFKKEFKRVIKVLYFPLKRPSKIENRTLPENEFIGENLNEIIIEYGELYKYEAGLTIIDSQSEEPKLVIKYRVFITVNNNYEIRDALDVIEKIISIPVKSI